MDDTQNRSMHLGIVASNGALCERMTIILVAGFVSADESEALRVLAGSSWDKVLRHLAEHAESIPDADLQSQILAWHADASSIKSARNRAIHDPILLHPDDRSVLGAMELSRKTKGYVLNEPENLPALIDKMIALVEAAAEVAPALSLYDGWHGDPRNLSLERAAV